MTISQPVKVAVDSLGARFISTSDGARELELVRAELHRLSEIADGVDPLVIRLGEVTTKLEAANALLLDFAKAVTDTAFKMKAPNQWTPIFVQMAQEAERQSHLQGPG